MRNALILSIAALALLSGCGSSVKSGVVTDKNYHPAYTTETQFCVTYNSQGFCTMWMPIPQQHSAEWCLEIESSSGKTGEYCVSESRGEEINIGDEVDFS